MSLSRLTLLALILLIAIPVPAAKKRPAHAKPAAPAKTKEEPRFSTKTFDGLELRNIGPAFMSGRIADVAIDPSHPSTWYVAVGSGGVWKTTNAGTTWKSIFDDQASYSIGCVTLDPSNPSVVWVGTGENVGGRHVGFGDGVYHSDDGGAHWEKRGLEKSEHISRIIVHPQKPEVAWVAAQGPLWSPGGERGLYKTTDGGKAWKKVLGGGDWTGVTDVVMDPRDPNLLYAATWQHERTVAAYLGGGPESRIYRSIDGGDTWTKLKEGLPEGNWGKVGLAISPQKPDVVYAAIELDRRKGGIWRSSDRGSTWDKRSDTVAGGTGPHYYQELVASPHAFDRIYLMDVRIQISDDGGKTFRRLTEDKKHSDNHALAFRHDDPDYLLVGTDGGLYETFDNAATWRFVSNLPVTQFYKIAVDDDKPFYNIYGGTQDNSTQGGPSRTDTTSGIRNGDWIVTLFADGYQPATEPGNPDIVYSEWQGGNLVRYDRTTGEIVYVTPQPESGEPAERFNWDAPILVSPHSPKRLYYASQRVWRSDDRGDRWRAISPDLTHGADRLRAPMMGRQWSSEAPWDLYAMSTWGTLTSLAESPVTEGLLYAGSDDGMLAVSEDDGAHWRKIEVSSMPGVPAGSFVNDIKADLFDASTVYVALDHHKAGDFSPCLLKSTDRGRTWRSMAGDLPKRHLVWRIVQDHVKRDLLFAGTEFGIFFTVDGGSKWVKLGGGVPTIPFRDLAIQRRENDLVGGSFGRGLWVLDDYSPLRQITDEALKSPAILFPIRPAWWYVPRRPLGDNGPAAQGAEYFTAPNPAFGAVFTYYLADDLESRADARKKAEKPAIEAGKDTPLPSWDALEAERREADPAILLTVSDAQGNVVRRLEGPVKKGFHRVAWDLRLPPTDPISETTEPPDEEEEAPAGSLAAPGHYTVAIAKRVGGKVTSLAAPAGFEVVPLRHGALPAASPDAVAAFGRRLDATRRRASAATESLKQATDCVAMLRKAISASSAGPELDAEIEAVRQELFSLDETLNGNHSKSDLAEPGPPTFNDRLSVAQFGTRHSTYGPTPTHQRSLDIAEQELEGVTKRLKAVIDVRLPQLETRLRAAGAPWSPGGSVP